MAKQSSSQPSPRKPSSAALVKPGTPPKKLAVALRYVAKENEAPLVVAKGQDQFAEQILKLAKEHGVPIREDKNLVQILSLLDLNQEIPPVVYAAVAEILAFVHKLGRQTPRRSVTP